MFKSKFWPNWYIWFFIFSNATNPAVEAFISFEAGFSFASFSIPSFNRLIFTDKSLSVSTGTPLEIVSLYLSILVLPIAVNGMAFK